MSVLYCIKISSWTSSFRYPNLITSRQPTLLVPPISTILGIINACAGRYMHYESLRLGYYFEYGAIAEDLETIYQIEAKGHSISNQVKPNVIRRQFLYDNQLYIFLEREDITKMFKAPIYPILLGRSNDLATIDYIKKIDQPHLIENASKIKGQIIPLKGNFLPGSIQPLPQYFTDTIPRKNIGTEAYSVIPYTANDFETKLSAYHINIEDKEIDIYMHQLHFDHE